MSQLKRFVITILLIMFLVYTRFINVGWGLPCPMHPDERNMADAITRLTCENPLELIQGMIFIAPQNAVAFLTTGSVYGFQKKISCLNPGFFAYGQLSLYAGYGIALILKGLLSFTKYTSDQGAWWAVNFQQAILGLRIWSATISCFIPFVMLRTLQRLNPLFKEMVPRRVALILSICSPIFIQFAHFGTTETILMLLYMLIVDSSLALLEKPVSRKKIAWKLILVSGLAIATKASSILFLTVPAFAICIDRLAKFPTLTLPMRAHNNPYPPPSPTTHALTEENIDLHNAHDVVFHTETQTLRKETTIYILLEYIARTICWFVSLGLMYAVFIALSFIISFIFSPHNILSLGDLWGSMRYESDVGLGRYIAFYTRQFLFEVPVEFHMMRIFPYALGTYTLLFSLIGIFFVPYKKKENILRFALLSLFFLTSVWYAKWTRFMAPLYPLMVVFALLAGAHIYGLLGRFHFFLRIKKTLGFMIIGIMCLPGIAYLSVYTQKDVRFVASQWVFDNIPPNSHVLSETANVVDIPIPNVHDSSQKIPPNYHIQYISFNSYDVDQNLKLQKDFAEAQQSVDYIFVPSRRVFYNHTCVGLDGKITTNRHSEEKCKYLARTYPVLTKYYQDLFSGKLGFNKVAEISSYPRIELFGKTLLSFPDESAEETFTVFDHPVVRIYKRAQTKGAH